MLWSMSIDISYEHLACLPHSPTRISGYSQAWSVIKYRHCSFPQGLEKGTPWKETGQPQENTPRIYVPTSLSLSLTSTKTPNNRKLSTYFEGLQFPINFPSVSSNGAIPLCKVNRF